MSSSHPALGTLEDVFMMKVAIFVVWGPGIRPHLLSLLLKKARTVEGVVSTKGYQGSQLFNLEERSER